ncbi:MAG: peptidoglycan-binding domain-containing protein [Paracoccaceae bacterium]
MPRLPPLSCFALSLLSGCGLTGPATDPAAGDLAAARQSLVPSILAPGETPEGIDCIATETLPARIETVTLREELTPEVRANDGTLIAPATYASDSSETILNERETLRFAIPCPAATREAEASFQAVLQRALKVRGYYRGPVTAVNDAETQRAVRAYQAARGLDSPTLSLLAAQQLGLARHPDE